MELRTIIVVDARTQKPKAVVHNTRHEPPLNVWAHVGPGELAVAAEGLTFDQRGYPDLASVFTYVIAAGLRP